MRCEESNEEKIVLKKETKMKVFGIEYAPFSIPLERRLQTLAVTYYCSQFLIIGFVTFILLVSLASTRLWIIPVTYSVWWFYDRNTCIQGGRRSNRVRSWIIWNWFREYFPIQLLKNNQSTKFDPGQNYIFGVHPHGILCFGSFLNFATEATGFSSLFPGLKPYLLTLEGQFMMPLHRELFLFTGNNTLES